MNILKNFQSPQPFVASIIIACILTGYNIPIIIATGSQNLLTEFGILFILTTLTTLVIYLLSISKLLVRIVTIPLILISSSFLYFILFYKIKIYPPLMTAILETESSEAFELLSINLIIWISIFGFIPTYFIIKITQNISSPKKNRLIFCCIVILVSVFLKFNILNTYTILRPAGKSFKKNCPLLQPSYIFNKYLPYSYIYNIKLHLARSSNYLTQKKKDLTTKHAFALTHEENKKTFFVLVVGESARADRFSLNGYKKNTNPLLSQNNNLVSYTDCYSLDTSTVPAVPHIFIRDLKLKTQDEQKETSFIHILKHLGFKSFWLSSWRTRPRTLIYDISLEASTTAYAPHIATYHADTTDNNILLYDHALLKPLKETIANNPNGIIILHTKGSHGNYYYRIPKKFHRYSPICKDNCINNIALFNNTYDNTILYTDFFLSEVINILKDKNAILLYVSDHGESLGEGGFFSHSAPFETAPKEQIHIPMIWWASNKFLSTQVNIEKFTQIKNNFNKQIDQSYIFHSILDCIGVESTAINKNKSLCRKLTKNYSVKKISK